MKTCLNCSKPPKRKNYKYCSNLCQKGYEHRMFIEKWIRESRLGINSVSSINISRHIRRYLFQKFSSACSLCGWNKVHPVTQVIPLEVDHLDGNALNNLESNLRILCPNCHSLTPSFRNLNKGKGRVGRNKKKIII